MGYQNFTQERGSDNGGGKCVRTSLPIHTVHQILWWMFKKKGLGMY